MYFGKRIVDTNELNHVVTISQRSVQITFQLQSYNFQWRSK